MKQSTLLLLAAAGIGLWYFTKGGASGRSGQVAYLNNWADHLENDTDGMKQYFKDQVSRMTDQEVSDVYTFLHDYPLGTQLPAGGLRDRLAVISAKYSIFT